MHETFGGIEAYDGLSRAPAFDTHHTPPQVENDQQRQNAENGDGADPAQRHLMEMAPIAACRLLDRVGLRIGNAAAPLNRLELL